MDERLQLREQLPDQGGQLVGAVDHAAVLDVGALADDDAGVVTPEDGAEPDAGSGGHLDVADEDRRGRYVSVRMHARTLAFELEFRHPVQS